MVMHHLKPPVGGRVKCHMKCIPRDSESRSSRIRILMKSGGFYLGDRTRDFTVTSLLITSKPLRLYQAWSQLELSLGINCPGGQGSNFLMKSGGFLSRESNPGFHSNKPTYNQYATASVSRLDHNWSCHWVKIAQVAKAPTIITKIPARGHTGPLPSTSLDHHISLLVASRGKLFHARIPFDVFVAIIFQQSVLPPRTVALVRSSQSRGKPSALTIAGRKNILAHAMRSSSQSRPFVNFHWPTVHSLFQDIKYYVFWSGYFCTPVLSLNTPRWVITRVLPGSERRTFVMIVGALPPGLFIPSDNSSCDQAWSQLELSLGINSPGGQGSGSNYHICVRIRMYIRVCICIYVFVYIYTYVLLYIHMYACNSTCIHVYIYTRHVFMWCHVLGSGQAIWLFLVHCVKILCFDFLPILSDELFSAFNYSQFLMSLLATWNILRSTAADFGHRANSQLSSNRITFRKICLARM